MLHVQATVFTVNPLADPTRGGRWCSIQFWRDHGTPQVTQVCDYKWRLRTAETEDPTAEIEAVARKVDRFLVIDAVADVERIDRVVL